MSRIELARSSKGLIQRVEGMLRATLPRQARVTAVEGNSVWVRFLGEEETDPEAKFVSTVAGVPVATMGWVITLGGKKGLFVATGIPKTTTRSNQGPTSLSATTAGLVVASSPTVTFTGLGSAPRRVDGTIIYRFTSASGQYRPAIQFVGDSIVDTPTGTFFFTPGNGQAVTFGYSMNVTPSDEGEIEVKPAIRWNSGSIGVDYVYITATIS